MNKKNLTYFWSETNKGLQNLSRFFERVLLSSTLILRALQFLRGLNIFLFHHAFLDANASTAFTSPCVYWKRDSLLVSWEYQNVFTIATVTTRRFLVSHPNEVTSTNASTSCKQQPLFTLIAVIQRDLQPKDASGYPRRASAWVRHSQNFEPYWIFASKHFIFKWLLVWIFLRQFFKEFAVPLC